MKNANYRKHNDGTHNSSTYHKKDGTPIRAILKREAEKETIVDTEVYDLHDYTVRKSENAAVNPLNGD